MVQIAPLNYAENFIFLKFPLVSYFLNESVELIGTLIYSIAKDKPVVSTS